MFSVFSILFSFVLFDSVCWINGEEVISVCVDADGNQLSTCPETDEIASTESLSPSEQPKVFREVPGPPPQQYWVKFENVSPEIVELYYDDGRDGALQGKMEPGHSLNIGTYVGHVFFYRIEGQKRRLYQTIMETAKEHLLFKDPETRDREEKEMREQKQQFMKEYKEKTGKRWLAFYPRPKPILFMYPCNNIGDTYQITSNYTYYHCYPETDSEEDISKCRDDPKNPDNHVNLEWKVLSTSPRILELKNFLSNFEVEHVKDLARPLLKRSVTGAGGYENKARTSSNAWVKRSFSDVMDWVFRRLGHAIKVNESHLWDTIGSESVQVVHYEVGQQYKSHHDWSPKREQTRFATFLMYLSDMASPDAGGETEFPKVGMKVHPGKGSVAMFYDMLPDGNVDDLTLHAALPVKEGEKWLANVWIWDPNFS